ncbi:uncharacterized protein LOC132712220 [Pantherophis guttatus]|uniref:Uncharacterized protein LOC132712220 n=1 Tax=Pantherophis guttatus TaxID=94885 RepID=A0ABM3ZKP7_PANGU|nr:uncharacterized protein LOC132712220 [Pantherophis guttatus]
MKVLFALRKKHLPENAMQKFKKKAINVYQRAIAYLEKWYNFTDSVYEALSCFNLIDRINPPTLEEMTNIWLLSPWREELPPNTLFDEISALEEVYVHLQGDSSLDKWTYFFKKEPALSLLKLFQYCASIPVSNANVERIFSVMGNLWTDERNRLLVSVRNGICCSEECGGSDGCLSTLRGLLLRPGMADPGAEANAVIRLEAGKLTTPV